MAQVSAALERFDVESALRIVDSYVARLGNVTVQTFTRAAEAEAAEAAKKFADIAIAVSFDASHPRAAQLMRRNRLQFVQDLSRQQRRAIQVALSSAFNTGQGPREAARAFRDSIGLTEGQERAARNYERLLRAGSAEALDRQLRDRRFDPSVRRATGGEPLSAQQIRRMVDRYRARALALRAETIARTESVRISSIARQEGFAQALEDAGVDRSAVIRVWNATEDERTRDSHAEMDGQEVAVDEPFISGDGNRIMFPGDPSAPPGETINCRCVVTHELRAA